MTGMRSGCFWRMDVADAFRDSRSTGSGIAAWVRSEDATRPCSPAANQSKRLQGEREALVNCLKESFFDNPPHGPADPRAHTPPVRTRTPDKHTRDTQDEQVRQSAPQFSEIQTTHPPPRPTLVDGAFDAENRRLRMPHSPPRRGRAPERRGLRPAHSTVPPPTLLSTILGILCQMRNAGHAARTGTPRNEAPSRCHEASGMRQAPP